MPNTHSHGHNFKYSHPDRLKWQDPIAILNKIGLTKDQCFIDIGCNDGFFVLPAAEIIGTKGKIYGIDIDQSALERLNQKLLDSKINNVELIYNTGEDTIVANQEADIVFLGMVLHDFDDPVKVLSNAKEMLKESGAIYDLDWKKEKTTDLGPPSDIRFSPEYVEQLALQADLKVLRREDWDDNFYLITLVKD